MTKGPMATMARIANAVATSFFKIIARALPLTLLSMESSVAWACFDCREAVAAQVYGPDFFYNFLALLLPLVILLLVGVAAFHSDTILGKLRKDRHG